MGDVKDSEYMAVAVEDQVKVAPNNTNSKDKSSFVHTQTVKCVKRRTTLERSLIFFLFVVVLLVVLLIVGIILQSKKGSETCLSKDCVAAAGAMIDNIDPEVDPCDDFYQYSCGGWMKRNTIPEDKKSLNMMNELDDRLLVLSRGLLESKSEDSSEAVTKVKRLYEACIDEEAVDTHDVAPLLTQIESLGGWPVIDDDFNDDSWELEDIVARIRLGLDKNYLFTQKVMTDTKDTSSILFFTDQPYSFGLRSRDDFLKSEDDKLILAYKEFMMATVTELKPDVNETRVRQEMELVFQLEKQLANATTPQDQRRDVLLIYEKLTLKDLSKHASGFDWLQYFRMVFANEGVDESENLLTFDLPYLIRMAEIIRKTPKRVVANYLMWRSTMDCVDLLSIRVREHAQDYRRILDGESTAKPRWRTCVVHCRDLMVNALGAMFIREHFDEESKTVATVMVDDIRSVLVDILNHVPWMDEETKELAIEKATAIGENIGYDESLQDLSLIDRDFSSVNISRDMHFTNVLELWKYNALKMVASHRQKMVPSEKFSGSPITVNAFYYGATNQIYFPAGILQPPFYSKTYLQAMNYGAIGMVIGHELTHGFDDKGRNFDKDGILREWFSEYSKEKFIEMKQCLINQYSNFSEIQDGKKIYLNGVVSQGENIADNGGLEQAFLAYRKWVNRRGSEEQLLPGLELTGDQLFFLSFGQIWCSMSRPQSLYYNMNLMHPPRHYRVLGSLQNSRHFAKAFNCPVGSPMNPVDKCDVW